MDTPAFPAPPTEGPRLSVLAVVTRQAPEGPQILLVRRANPPQVGHWGFPGGKVEWGENLGQAAVRELREETGIAGTDPAAFEAIDLVEPGGHHLMVAVRLIWRKGEPVAQDDALEARWATATHLPQPLCADVGRSCC